MKVVIMGVSGSGKSTLAARLVERTGWPFAEGDDFHPEANRAKMAAGVPLTDEDRIPWLEALHDVLAGWQRTGSSGVMTCSALRQVYRERLAAGMDELRFIWLDPPRAQLEDRLAHRTGHYMNPSLLGSQLATLEPPADALHLCGGETPDQALAAVVAWLGI